MCILADAVECSLEKERAQESPFYKDMAPLALPPRGGMSGGPWDLKVGKHRIFCSFWENPERIGCLSPVSHPSREVDRSLNKHSESELDRTRVEL